MLKLNKERGCLNVIACSCSGWTSKCRKTTLFNKLVGQRISIVEDTPGVTRDRIYSKCEWRAREFMVVDTGGIEPASDDIIPVPDETSGRACY